MAIKDWKKGEGHRWYNRKDRRYIVLTGALNGLHEGEVGIDVREEEEDGFSSILEEKYFGKDNKTNTQRAINWAMQYMRTH